MFSLKFHHLSLFIWFYHRIFTQPTSMGCFLCSYFSYTGYKERKSIRNVFFVDKLPLYFGFFPTDSLYLSVFLFLVFLSTHENVKEKIHRTNKMFMEFNFISFFPSLLMSLNSFDSFMFWSSKRTNGDNF